MYMHQAIAEYHSEPLAVLISGSMAEAVEGCAVLEGVDVKTFALFAQFAYTGNYDDPKPDYEPQPPIDEDEIVIVRASTVAAIAGQPGGGVPLAQPRSARQQQQQQQPRAPKRRATSSFGSENDDCQPQQAPAIRRGGRTAAVNNSLPRTPPPQPPPPPQLMAPPPPAMPLPAMKELLRLYFRSMLYPPPACVPGFSVWPNKGFRSANYARLFKTHAKLYIFADCWMIPELRRLSLFKLSETLAAFTLYGQRVGDVLQLIRYAYDNTRDRTPHAAGAGGSTAATAGGGTSTEGKKQDTQAAPMDLRMLVARYAACYFDKLSTSSDFSALLAVQGEFGRDLLVPPKLLLR
jgi:hypothetical protein